MQGRPFKPRLITLGEVKVNDGRSSFERVIGAYPAVDLATGTVYDSWHDYARNTIYVDKSTNGGASDSSISTRTRAASSRDAKSARPCATSSRRLHWTRRGRGSRTNCENSSSRRRANC